MEIRSIISAALCLLCVACGNIRTFQIETYNPADITYPDGVSKVLLVNNAVPQPDSIGYRFTLAGKSQDTCRAKADSALMAFCRSLGTAIADASYFEDVLLYNEPVRNDGNYLRDVPLKQEEVRQLCEENDVDAIISLERMVFVMEKDVEPFLQMGMEYGRIKVRVRGILRTYAMEREQPLAAVLVSDSVMWEEIAPDFTALDELLPPPDIALEIAADYIGSKLSNHFVPHWTEASRWFYTNAGAIWKEASAYASAGKWEEAEKRWKAVAQQSTNQTTLAEVYTNLALACEMQNNFSDAYDWACKAESLFKEVEGENGKNANMLEVYAEVLRERINADKKLNIQIGE